MPFATEYEREIHFSKHGHNFGAANAIDYENMADAFMFRPMTIGMRECIQPAGINRLRYGIVNRHLGVALVAPPEFVKTFYQVPVHTIAHHGGHAPFFGHQCARMDV